MQHPSRGRTVHHPLRLLDEKRGEERRREEKRGEERRGEERRREEKRREEKRREEKRREEKRREEKRKFCFTREEGFAWTHRQQRRHSHCVFGCSCDGGTSLRNHRHHHHHQACSSGQRSCQPLEVTSGRTMCERVTPGGGSDDSAHGPNMSGCRSLWHWPRSSITARTQWWSCTSSQGNRRRPVQVRERSSR